MTTYIELCGCSGSGGGGSAFWADPVANFAALPLTDDTGTVRLTLNDGAVYWWDGVAWDLVNTELGVTDSNSIDLTLTSGNLTADARISATAATAGFFKATTTIKGGGSPGFHVEAEIASGSQTGFISSADWTTFNNKEPAISAGTTSQYWRGDKSFQTLNTAALLAVTDGSSAGAGIIGEILTGSQATATSTGVGATGTFGNATSVSLTAGVWHIEAIAGFAENGAVLTDSMSGAISSSATGVGLTALDIVVHNNLVSSTADLVVPCFSQIVSLSGTTTYYLNTRFFYSSGSPQHYGRIRARRIR